MHRTMINELKMFIYILLFDVIITTYKKKSVNNKIILQFNK